MKEFDWRRSLARRARNGVMALTTAVFCTTTLPVAHVFAQDDGATGGATGVALPMPPLFAPLSGLSSAEMRVVASQGAPALKPMEPQVGPPIKHYYEDFVDRRTTAYIPENLDDMTPIEMPVTDENWVRVDLSEQRLVAYSGQTPVRAFIISSGLPNTPTVVGEFRIRAKVRSQLMEGGSRASDNYYNLPNVEWVQYFYDDYALHGTYWHNDFGRPKSHGCVNMTNADAKWLWEFLGPEWDGSAWQRTTDDNRGSLVIVTE